MAISVPARAGCAVLFAAQAIAGPGSVSAQELDRLAPRVLEELEAPLIACPEGLSSDWLCGQFDAGFSRLKFELEVELDLKDYEARPLTPWRLRDGSYERAWAVLGQRVTMKFGRTDHVVALRQEPLQDEEDATDGEAAEGERSTDEAEEDDDEADPNHGSAADDRGAGWD